MRKEQVMGDDVFAVAEGHICQRDPLEGLVWEVCQKRTFCRFEIGDGVFEVAGNFVSVSSRAGRRIGFAPSCDNQLVSCPCFFSRLDDKDVFWLGDGDHFAVGGNAST